MAHPADFSDAHSLHWEDAELLYDRERWANADQLYGFSAECGLKAVMLSLGMDVHPATGMPKEKEHQTHVRKLWSEFTDFVAGRDGARYLVLLPRDTPFDDWSHHDRYANRSHFAKARVDPHREAARTIRDMVQKLTRDGPL